MVADLDRRIEHHLARARTAAAGAGSRARADIGTVVPRLVQAMRQIHRERRLSFDAQVPIRLLAGIDGQDLEEMLGNLLDNACRHARTTVRITTRDDEQLVLIQVEDDGAGIAKGDVPQALAAGSRLDESGRGYGFGLAISQELAELYGGALELGRSARLGGLAATLALPRAA